MVWRLSHLLSSSLHYLQRNGINLMVKLGFMSFESHKHSSEVCPSEIQSKVISIFWSTKCISLWTDYFTAEVESGFSWGEDDGGNNNFKTGEVKFAFIPVPSGVWYTKEGSIFTVQPLPLSPASSPSLILDFTNCSCCWFSLKRDSASSTFGNRVKACHISTIQRRSIFSSPVKTNVHAFRGHSHPSSLWCQTLSYCCHQGGTFAATTLWESKPDLTIGKQPPHNFMKAFRIPEKV